MIISSVIINPPAAAKSYKRRQLDLRERERWEAERGEAGVGAVYSNARHPWLGVIKPLSKSTVQKLLCPPKRAFNF